MVDREKNTTVAGARVDAVIRFPKSEPYDPEGGDVRMDKINAYAFYILATELQPLNDVPVLDGQVSLRGIFFPLWTAEQALDKLISGNPIKLDFSRAAAVDLRSNVSTQLRTHFFDEKGKIKFPSGDDDPKIYTWSGWNNVTGALATFLTVFKTEMENATIYQVSKKGIYSMVELVERAEEIFPPELIPFIPQKTRDDFHAAGRCLAFSLPTAAGFHAARGVEGELELYWQTFTKKTGTRFGWQDYIDDLQKVIDLKVSPMPDQRTVKTLEVIKDHDRNPVMHPRDVVLDDMDARILFSSAECLVLAMAKEVRDANKGTGITPLSAVKGT
jgi:hypothetical protein